ncbi:4-hydroxy-3-methylbut-2-enyl diphosphate reductase, partial [Helicobacter pylori]
MEIKMAKDYGFCFGVKRAIQIAEKNQNSLIFGSLIHNAKEINRLEKNFNVKIEEDPKKIPKNKSVIIRT